ncbi:MAG: recombination mediator RecR [Deltaproteobacteria bacterium]|nr:recombination mediator RecR [Deltaproteobacteria bacterium]
MNVPPSLVRLVDQLARLPGIGQKTAHRLAFHILREDPAYAHTLARALEDVKANIRFCQRCFGYAEDELCPVCRDPSRDTGQLCVVEQPDNVFVLERAGVFKGRYHVLMGAISPLDGIGPGQLKIQELENRLAGENIQEVILATNPSMEGEATALHLARLLAGRGVNLTRLARGMPMGGNLEFTDDVTLFQAFSHRQTFGGE